ncbi:putative serine/threonine-protein kinase tsuA, partial [Frankliniella fusca]
MAPGRFRRRLSDDHSDAGEPLTGPGPAETSGGTGTGTGTASRSWLGDGTGSTRARLPWLSPRERRHPLRDVRLSCFRSYLPGSVGASTDGDGLESAAPSPRTPRTPRLHAPPGTPRVGDKEDKQGRGLTLSVRRSPGRARGTKSSENVYFVSPPRPQPDQDAPSDHHHQHQQQQ